MTHIAIVKGNSFHPFVDRVYSTIQLQLIIPSLNNLQTDITFSGSTTQLSRLLNFDIINEYEVNLTPLMGRECNVSTMDDNTFHFISFI